jgi:hypothetical protein
VEKERFAELQIVPILQDAEAKTSDATTKQHGVVAGGFSASALKVGLINPIFELC